MRGPSKMAGYQPVTENGESLPERINSFAEKAKASVAYVSNWLEVHEVGKQAGEATESVLKQYRGYVYDGPFTFRVACFLSGSSMVVCGIYGIFVEGGFMNTLINFYQVGFGVLTVGLESHKALFSPGFKDFLFEYFRFLFTLFGRGFFYILVGVVILSANPWWFNFFVGAFAVGTGVASLVYGVQTKRKLGELKYKIGDEVMARQTFARYDGDGDLRVTVAEFAALLDELNVALNRQELEAAVALVGDDMERTIHVDRFVDWYKEQLLDGGGGGGGRATSEPHNTSTVAL